MLISLSSGYLHFLLVYSLFYLDGCGFGENQGNRTKICVCTCLFVKSVFTGRCVVTFFLVDEKVLEVKETLVASFFSVWFIRKKRNERPASSELDNCIR